MARFPNYLFSICGLCKFLCLYTLSIFSPLTAALHVLDLILKFILCTVGPWERFGYSCLFIKNIGKRKARREQSMKQTHQELHQ